MGGRSGGGTLGRLATSRAGNARTALNQSKLDPDHPKAISSTLARDAIWPCSRCCGGGLALRVRGGVGSLVTTLTETRPEPPGEGQTTARKPEPPLQTGGEG